MPADADDRDERRVRALAQRLRAAIEQGVSRDRLRGLTEAALGSDRTDADVDRLTVAHDTAGDPPDGPPMAQ